MPQKMKTFLEKIHPAYFFGENTFTVLFYSTLAIYFCTGRYSFSIHSFERIISLATLENISIVKRVHLFYLLALFFLVSFFTLTYLMVKLEQWLDQEEIKILNYSSLMALGIVFFNLVGMPAKKSLLFLIHFQAFVLICAGIEKSLFKKKISCFLDYLWSVVIVISLYYFFVALSKFLPPLPMTLYLPFFVFPIIIRLAVVAMSMRLKDGGVFQKSLYVITSPLTALPLFFCLTIEICLILNNRGYYWFVPYKIYALELMILSTAGFLLYFFRKKFLSVPITKIIFSWQLPLLLFGLLFCFLYQPFIAETKDLYETPNMTFMVQQFFEFGKIPFLESFSPHFLCDSFFPFIYSFINGFHGYDICIYNFLVPTFAGLFFYFFFYKILKEPLLGLFLMFLTPIYFDFTGSLTHSSFSFKGSYTHWVAGIIIFLLANVMKKNDFISYLTLWAYIVFTFLWRFDMGSAALISSFLCLILFSFLPGYFKINKTALGFSLLLLTTILLSTVIALASFKQVDLFLLAKDFFHLIKADPQNSGYLDIAGYSKKYIFLFHYFVFPAGLLLILVYLLTDFKDILQTSYRSLYIGLIYFIFYYFIMFTRALVRHNILENTDAFSGGMVYLIFCTALFLILRKHSRILRLSVFMLAAALLMFLFKVPALRLDNLNLFEQLTTKEYTSLSLEKKWIDRVQEYFFAEHFAHFKRFLDDHLEKSETFLDFSNSPMLYFYTHRNTPSYSCHPPSSLFDEYLQKRYINELQNYKAPIVVFSNPNGGLVFDGLPSNLRQFRVAAYIYSHYEPYGELDGLQLWVLKNDRRFHTSLFSFKADERLVLRDSLKGLLPVLMPLNPPLTIKPGKHYSLRLNYEFNHSGFIKLFWQTNHPVQTRSFYLPAGQQTLNIPISVPKNLTRLEALIVRLSQPNGFLLQNADIIEEDFPIDSSLGYLPQSYNLKYLPYLQGEHEKELFYAFSDQHILAQKQIRINDPKKTILFDFNRNDKLKFNDLKRIEWSDNRLKINSGADDPFIFNFLIKPIFLSPDHSYRLSLEYESRTGGNVQLFWNRDATGFNENDSAFYKLSAGINILSIDLPLPYAQSLDDLRLDPPGNDTFTIHHLTLMEYDPFWEQGLKFIFKNNKYKQDYIILKGSNRSDKMVPIELAYGDDCKINGRFTFYMPPHTSDHIYMLRPGVNYNWSAAQNNTIYVDSTGLAHIQISEIKIIPDPTEP